jgi:hypothetical protein
MQNMSTIGLDSRTRISMPNIGTRTIHTYVIKCVLYFTLTYARKVDTIRQ